MAMVDYNALILPAAKDCCKDTQSLTSMLRLMAMHPSLAPDNILLLDQQMPEATAVGGYNAWQQGYDRKVKPDAKPILLLRPTICKVTDNRVPEDDDGVTPMENGNVESEECAVDGVEYLPVHLYDVSQTIPSDKTPDTEQPYLLTPTDIISGFRGITKCAVKHTDDVTGKLARYDALDNTLITATDDKSIVAQECLTRLCVKAAGNRIPLDNKVYISLVAECAAEVVCRINHIKTDGGIKFLAIWNKDGNKNEQQCLELLNQISLASRVVLSQLRQATGHPVLLDFNETCLLNEVLDKPNAIAARLRLSNLAKHTSVPVIVESINSLRIKMMYFESSNQVDKIFKDRLEHKIMTQPVYHV